jgi:hypothetical protein
MNLCVGLKEFHMHRTLIMKNGSFSGFESLLYGALEAHVLLIVHVLKFYVCFSALIKKTVHRVYLFKCKQL